VSASGKERKIPFYGFKVSLMVPNGSIGPYYKNGIAFDWTRSISLGKHHAWGFRYGFQYARIANRADTMYMVEAVSYNNSIGVVLPQVHVNKPIGFFNSYFDFSRLLYRQGKFDAFCTFGATMLVISERKTVYLNNYDGWVDDSKIPVCMTFKGSLLLRYKVNSRLFYIAEGTFTPAVDVDYGKFYTNSTFGIGINYSLHEE
jgi:hypothetical protein